MEASSKRPGWDAVLAVALVSFSILAAEVALTRIFSVLFRAPYVFLIVSGATGGLGLGGLLVQFLRPAPERARGWIVGLSVTLALALAAPVLLLFASPWGQGLVAQAEITLVVLLPMTTFLIGGMLLAFLFRQYPAAGGFLYFVDLGAAALAAPVSVLLLDRLGGLNTPLALGLAAAAAGAALALRSGSRAWAAVSCLTVLGLSVALGTNLRSQWITLPPLQTPPEAVSNPSHPWHATVKPLFEELGSPFSGSRIVRTDWSAVSRTDVVYDPGMDLYHIYTDGDVPTQMEPWDGNLDHARREYSGFIGALPFHLARLAGQRTERVMAIGSGGGLDVLLALCAGAKQVDAVEINPSIPRIVTDPRFAHTYAQVYRAPGVRLVVDEGRSFLQRSGRYDVIYFACAKTATTQTSGVALLDNHLYTVEAFRDYWRHLSDQGAVALITQDPVVVDRLLLTALAALQKEGVPPAEAANHLLIAQVPQAQFPTTPYRYLLLLRRRAWKADEAATAGRITAQVGLVPIYLPQVQPRAAGGARFDPQAPFPEIQAALEAQYPIPAAVSGSSRGTDLANLSPVTDDSPFYVDLARGLHPTLAQLLWGAALATLLVVGAVALSATRLLRQAPRENPEDWEPLARPAALPLVGAGVVYFALLGAGFMAVELALMQQFILLLGFPTRALTVTLFALLLSSACGSFFSQRGTPQEAGRRLRLLLPALAGLLVVYRFLLPPLIGTLLPAPLPLRVAVTALFLFPPGFLMGMPFPTVLRNLQGVSSRLVPGFWSINGVTSILGSVATMALAKFVGYSGALLAGAACYGIAWAAATVLLGRRVEDPPEAVSG